MRTLSILLTLTVVATCSLEPASATDRPLTDNKFTIKASQPGKHKLSYKGRWSGTLAGATPDFTGATLEVSGGDGEGGTGVLGLDPAGWTALSDDKGFQYKDSTGAAGGITKIQIKNGKNGKPGRLKLTGAKSNFVYELLADHTEVQLSLAISDDTWCAFAYEPSNKTGRVGAKSESAPPSCSLDLVVDVAWLQANLDDPNLQVIDTRTSFSGGHVPGAIPLLPTELATTVDGVGGQMVNIATAEAVLGNRGLRDDATIVVYGSAPEYDPARVAWALRYVGHDDVRYLDGGFDAWVASGASADPGAPEAPAPETYASAGALENLRVDGAWILDQLGDPPYDESAIQLVDARSLGEYLAGRIPTAELEQWGNNLDDGKLRSGEFLESLYADLGLDPTKTTVTYCLVGWRASVAWLVLTWLGFDDVRVYDGSWAEWGAGGFPVESR